MKKFFQKFTFYSIFLTTSPVFAFGPCSWVLGLYHKTNGHIESLIRREKEFAPYRETLMRLQYWDSGNPRPFGRIWYGYSKKGEVMIALSYSDYNKFYISIKAEAEKDDERKKVKEAVLKARTNVAAGKVEIKPLAVWPQGEDSSKIYLPDNPYEFEIKSREKIGPLMEYLAEVLNLLEFPPS